MESLQYRPDFTEVRRRWERWWGEGMTAGRPLWIGAAPRPDAPPAPRPDPMTLLTEDIDAFGDRLEQWADNRVFAADTVPGCVVCFGADHFAGLLGAEMTADPENRTTWITPCVEDWRACDLRPRWDAPVARRTLECVRRLRRRFDGRLLISPPHLQGNLDCLAALRGVQPLLFDLVDDPEAVHAALERVNAAFAEVVAVFREEFATDRFGAVNRHGLYSPGFNGLLQCDFSCMVGPEMFETFAVPALRFEARTVDQAEYHLDGPGAVVHLDALAAVPEIGVIQFQPGIAREGDDWRDLYRRVDALGFGQYFYRPTPELRGWIRNELAVGRTVLDLSQNAAVEALASCDG